jgi:hypothetical protein
MLKTEEILIMDNQQESLDWFKLPDFKNYYCTASGLIGSKARGKLKILKPHKHYGRVKTSFYLRIEVSSKLYLVHRLIASAKYQMKLDEFSHLQVNHIDANKANNSFENIELVTSEQNVKHAVELNLYQSGSEWYAARSRNLQRSGIETRTVSNIPTNALHLYK